LRIWLQTPSTSPYFTIIAYKAPVTQSEGSEENAEGQEDVLAIEDNSLTGFAEIVEVTSFSEPPRVLKIMPYQKVPIRTVSSSGDSPVSQ
jgi:hypothetical protein